MKPFQQGKKNIAYQWLSWCLLIAFGYYWLFTIGLVLFGKSVSAIAPNQTVLYRTFARQNWRLFAISKVYNRQMLFITRDIQNPSVADTTDIVQYLLAVKRKAAPFNNYEDAMDRILYIVMNGVEIQMMHQKEKLQKQSPGQTPDFYLRECCLLVEADSARYKDIGNITAFGKYMMKEKGLPTNGKEHQLIITHKYIPPSKPAAQTVSNGDAQTIFVSTYKPL